MKLPRVLAALCVVCLLLAPARAWCAPAPAAPLSALVTNADRAAIAQWCAAQPASNINAALQALTPAQRRQLLATAFDCTAPPAARARLLEAAALLLDNPLLGFYLELFAATQIRVHDAAGGGYAAGDHISISTGIVASTDITRLRNTLTHELFHIFNGRNRAATGISGLNEGTAIWIFKCAYDDLPRDEYDLGLAEPTFGTLNYYRDLGIKGYPRSIAMGTPTQDITPKGREVYETILMARDPSRLPVFDDAALQAVYTNYFSGIRRDQEFAAWLQAFRAAHQRMLRERQ